MPITFPSRSHGFAAVRVGSLPRVTVAAMVVATSVPTAEHPAAIAAADATIASAEEHVQAGSALESPPVIATVKSTVWLIWKVSAAGGTEAARGGGGLGAIGPRVPASEQPASTITANTLLAVARFRCIRLPGMLTGPPAANGERPGGETYHLPTPIRTRVRQGVTHEIVTRHGGIVAVLMDLRPEWPRLERSGGTEERGEPLQEDQETGLTMRYRRAIIPLLSCGLAQLRPAYVELTPRR